jgi:parallel beta-helix repeat protein
MKKIVSFNISILIFVLITNLFPLTSTAQQFVHPGINQNSKDLAFMKKMVLEGKQPYKDAFIKLKAAVDSNFSFKPFTHVLRGPYGKPNIGGDDLLRSANMAYNYALVWYITENKMYAQKAIEIINAWSLVVWDFDYNDAKLLAAWTGHLFCNAAEILRYTDAGWQQKDNESFTNMLMTVYYPLMRYYFPQANGNWNGAIIHSIMAIAIFTDNRTMFNNAVDNYLHAPVNGSVFKYIYANGQCQESPRDQGHVQLGLGEFAGAAQIAYTQGVDLLSIADNRLALGYEYTAKFLLGENPHCYCTISPVAKTLRDDYEYVYRHYAAQGIEVPWIKRAADSIRSKASRSVLTAVRVPIQTIANEKAVKMLSVVEGIKGAGTNIETTIPENAFIVSPGQSIQEAINTSSRTGRWVVLKKGIHKFAETLKIPSGITIKGEGLGTILFLDPNGSNRDAMVNANNDVKDITIRDLVIEGSTKTEVGSDPNTNRSNKGGYNRGGIVFRSLNEGQMKNINFINLTVQNCTYNGVFISGAENISITNCDFNENGGNAIPGPKLQHNLLLSHCKNVKIIGNRMATSPFGAGIALDHCINGVISGCEIARNAYYGILISESSNLNIKENLIEANDRTGVMVEYLYHGSSKINVTNNIIQYNEGYGVATYSALNGIVQNNKYAGNGHNPEQEKISIEKKIVME